MMGRMIAAMLLVAGCAAAQPMAMPAAPGDSPATAAYKQAAETMMKNMAVAPTGNPDHDFVAGMLPHHQGAIDMARIELRYGHDPALQRLAREIIASQAKEQVFMRSWLARHPAPTAR